MFDLFGGVTPALDRANQLHLVNYLALMIALEEKGILTEDDISRARITATHLVEQAWAKKRDDAEKEFDKKHPGVRQLFGDICGE